MPIEKSWHRPWVCRDGHCRKDPIGTNVWVLTCDHCGKATSVTTYGAGEDPALALGWKQVGDKCYCKDCK